MATMLNKMINPRPPRLAGHSVDAMTYKEFIRNLGVLIKEYREEAHVTQRDLGSDIDKTVTHISAIENGRRGVSLHALFLIAQSLRVDLSQLIKEALNND